MPEETDEVELAAYDYNAPVIDNLTQSIVVLCGIDECVYGSTEVGGWKDM